MSSLPRDSEVKNGRKIFGVRGDRTRDLALQVWPRWFVVALAKRLLRLAFFRLPAGLRPGKEADW